MKNLKLMLVALACLFGSLLGQKAYAYTVYFVDGGLDWSQTRVFLRDSDDKHNNSGWPGAELTETGNKYQGKTVYEHTFTPNGWTPAVLVFNNNGQGQQTKDITPTDGALYVVNGTGDNAWTEVKNPVFDGGGDDPTPKTYKAYIVNNSGWSSGVRAHIWEEDKDGYKTNWPGVKLTLTDTGKKYDNQQVYSFEVDLTFNPKSILFNNPADENSKTTNQTFGEGYLYVLSGTTCTAYDKDSWSYDTTPDPTPTGDLYMYGNINGAESWNTPTSGLNLGAPVSNVYTYKVTFTAASNWFKFHYNGKNFMAESNDLPVKLETEYTANTENATNNAYLVSTGEGKNFEQNKEYTLTVNYNGSGNNLTFKFSDGTPTPPTPTYPTNFILKGWQGSSDFVKYTTADRDAEGKYAFSINLTKNYNWFFETSDARYVPEGSSNLNISEGGTFKTQKKPGLSYESHQFSLTPGKYNGTAWFEEDGTISFTIAKEVVEETWPDLYIIGKFTEEWKFRDRFKTSSTDGKYTWTFSSFPYGGQEWKVSGADYSVEYSAGEIMPSGNASARTIDYNKSYVCNSKTKGESKGLGNMIMSASVEVPVTVTLDLTTSTPRISIVAEGEIVEPNKYRTLYMSFGQQRISYGNLDKKPRIHFCNERQATSIDKSALTDSDPEMTEVYPGEENSPIWMYTLTEEEYNSVKDYVFYFHQKEGDPQQYVAGLADDWDFENRTKFMYYVDNGRAAQSYITFAEYDKIKGETKTDLYIVGQGFQGLKGWNPMPSTEDTATTLHVTAERGIFYQEVKLDTTGELASSKADDESEAVSGAKFKMSWIRPYDYYKNLGKPLADMDRQRSWATFNLGIVGYARSHKAVISGQLPVKTDTSSEENSAVFCTPNRIIPNNNYNQYDWFIRRNYLEGDVEYTLVVDLTPGTNTTALIPCSPNPTVEAAGITMTPLDLADNIADAITIWENSADRLAAEKTNGKNVITRFNIASAEATINAPTHETIKNLEDPTTGNKMEYKIYYDIYSGEDLVGTYSGQPGAVTIDGVAFGEDAELGVRARYVSPVTDLSFHSKLASQKITVETANLPAPAIGEITEHSFTHGTNNLDSETEPFYTLGAYALVPVTTPSTDYTWYADFKVSTNGHHIEHPQHANGGEVVYNGHAATKLQGVTVNYLNGFNPWSEGAEYTEANDWSGKLAASNAWPLHLPEVVRVDRTYSSDGKTFTETEAKAEVNVEVRAVYPFLVDPRQQVQVSAARAARAPRRAFSFDPNRQYIVKLESSAPVTATFSLGAGDLTGVKDIIAAPAADGEVEYYNLQGVRMEGELAPGLYIRRQGTESTKVVIR